MSPINSLFFNPNDGNTFYRVADIDAVSKKFILDYNLELDGKRIPSKFESEKDSSKFVFANIDLDGQSIEYCDSSESTEYKLNTVQFAQESMNNSNFSKEYIVFLLKSGVELIGETEEGYLNLVCGKDGNNLCIIKINKAYLEYRAGRVKLKEFDNKTVKLEKYIIKADEVFSVEDSINTELNRILKDTFQADNFIMNTLDKMSDPTEIIFISENAKKTVEDTSDGDNTGNEKSFERSTYSFDEEEAIIEDICNNLKNFNYSNYQLFDTSDMIIATLKERKHIVIAGKINYLLFDGISFVFDGKAAHKISYSKELGIDKTISKILSADNQVIVLDDFIDSSDSDFYYKICKAAKGRLIFFISNNISKVQKLPKSVWSYSNLIDMDLYNDTIFSYIDECQFIKSYVDIKKFSPVEIDDIEKWKAHYSTFEDLVNNTYLRELLNLICYKDCDYVQVGLQIKYNVFLNMSFSKDNVHKYDELFLKLSSPNNRSKELEHEIKILKKYINSKVRSKMLE